MRYIANSWCPLHWGHVTHRYTTPNDSFNDTGRTRGDRSPYNRKMKGPRPFGDQANPFPLYFLAARASTLPPDFQRTDLGKVFLNASAIGSAPPSPLPGHHCGPYVPILPAVGHFALQTVHHCRRFTIPSRLSMRRSARKSSDIGAPLAQSPPSRPCSSCQYFPYPPLFMTPISWRSAFVEMMRVPWKQRRHGTRPR